MAFISFENSAYATRLTKFTVRAAEIAQRICGRALPRRSPAARKEAAETALRTQTIRAEARARVDRLLR